MQFTFQNRGKELQISTKHHTGCQSRSAFLLSLCFLHYFQIHQKHCDQFFLLNHPHQQILRAGSCWLACSHSINKGITTGGWNCTVLIATMTYTNPMVVAFSTLNLHGISLKNTFFSNHNIDFIFSSWRWAG